jgi:hypothetical protein
MKYVLLLIVLLCSLNLQAQRLQLLNTSLTRPDSAVAFTGSEQQFILKGEIAGRELRIERSAGSVDIRPGTSVRFSLRYDSTGTDTFRIALDGKTVLEKVYRIQNPDCPLSFGVQGQRGDSIGLAALTQQAGPGLISPDCLYRPKGILTSYTLSISSLRGNSGRYTVKGDTWPAELKNNTTWKSPGNTLIFSNITCSDPTGKPIRFQETRLRIIP